MALIYEHSADEAATQDKYVNALNKWK